MTQQQRSTVDQLHPWWTATAALVGLLSISACGSGVDTGRADSSQALPAVQVSTALAARADMALEITATGSIVARAGSFATLSAPGPTRVTRVLVAVGDRVQVGQALIVLDRTPFSATSQQANAAAQVAREAETRAGALVAQGIWPRRELEQARAARLQADAAVTLAQRGLDLATLRAPLRGVVSRLYAAIGASADAMQPLVEVVDPAAIEVRLALSPGDAARVRAGTEVWFTVDGGTSAPAQPLGVGAVTSIAPQVDSLTGAVDVRARLIAPTRQPRLGEVVTAHLRTDVHAGAVAVPAVSLVSTGDGYQVFIVSTGDTAHARAVTVGRRSGALAEILAGVAVGERVVTEGAFGVEDGSPLRRTSTSGAGSSTRSDGGGHDSASRGRNAGKP